MLNDEQIAIRTSTDFIVKLPPPTASPRSFPHAPQSARPRKQASNPAYSDTEHPSSSVSMTMLSMVEMSSITQPWVTLARPR